MTIDPAQRCLTLIDVIKVDPQRTSELMKLLQEISDEVMAHQPGFMGAALHPSLDGSRVVSYVKWQSHEAWEAATKRDEARARFALVARIVHTIEPSLYRVETVHGAKHLDEP
jgi:quinol monooxygenase YgiN